MPKAIETPAKRCARELRSAGIEVRAHRTRENTLVFPTLGPDDVAAIRMINPAVQRLHLRCGVTSQLKKK